MFIFFICGCLERENVPTGSHLLDGSSSYPVVWLKSLGKPPPPLVAPYLAYPTSPYVLNAVTHMEIESLQGCLLTFTYEMVHGKNEGMGYNKKGPCLWSTPKEIKGSAYMTIKRRKDELIIVIIIVDSINIENHSNNERVPKTQKWSKLILPVFMLSLPAVWLFQEQMVTGCLHLGTKEQGAAISLCIKKGLQ